MRTRTRGALAAAFIAAGVCSVAQLAPIEMQGDFIWTAVGTDGSLGVGYDATPGLIHDPSGTGDFNPLTDYVTPGSPFEGFSVSIGTGEYRTVYANNNDSASSPEITPVSITDVSASSAYDHAVRWVGEVSGQFRITHEFYFNDGDEQIHISTSIEAMSDLVDVLYQRIVDPDPDVGLYGDYDTQNGRGYDANGDGDYTDAKDIAPEDFVHSEGLSTGRTLSLESHSAVPHNTAVDDGWSEDPADTIEGYVDDVLEDDTIALAFDVGDLTEAEIAELVYAYVMGATLEDIVGPSGSARTSKPPIQNLVNSGMRAVANELSRRNHARRLSASSNLGKDAGWQTWARQIGTWFDRDEEDGLPGYDGDMRHSLLGMERSYGSTLYGLAFGAGKIRMDMDDEDTSDADFYTASAYGSWNGDSNYVTGGLTYSYSDIAETYSARGAEADMRANAYAIHLLAGHEFPINEWLSVCPEAGGRLTYYDQGAYNEDGVGGRDVEEYDKWFQEVTAGISLVGTKDVSENLSIRPEATVAWVYEFNEDADNLGYVGPGTTTGYHETMGPERDFFHTTLGVTATYKSRYQCGVDVIYDFASGSSVLGVGGFVGVEF